MGSTSPSRFGTTWRSGSRASRGKSPCPEPPSAGPTTQALRPLALLFVFWCDSGPPCPSVQKGWCPWERGTGKWDLGRGEGVFLDSDACGVAQNKPCGLWSALGLEPGISDSLSVPDVLARGEATVVFSPLPQGMPLTWTIPRTEPRPPSSWRAWCRSCRRRQSTKSGKMGSC